MIFTPNASWVSTNSRSKRSIKTSRFPGWTVYCLNSTTGQQGAEDCICLSPIGSGVTDLTTPRAEIKKAGAKYFRVVFTVSKLIMLARFFPSLVWLLLASVAAAQSWHADSHYVRLGPRTGYYVVRPGSQLSRQLGLEGAPISDTADPFCHGRRDA